MEFTVSKDIDTYKITENKRMVFHVTYVKEHGMVSMYLKNMYDDTVMGIYEIHKWYSRLHSFMEFALYEGDELVGELKKTRKGYELVYHDMYYQFYCGIHAGKRMVICFDHDEQIGEFTFDDISRIKFKQTSLQGVWTLVAVLMKAFIDEEHFSPEAFFQHYLGVYHDASNPAA